MIRTFALNCDLGEGEPPARTAELMSLIDLANVACGGHAGGAATLRACARLARRRKVRFGAHPGPWSREDMGRGAISITPDELELLLAQQVGAAAAIAASEGVALHHVKLHGSLYHATDSNPALARRYLETVRSLWPRAKIVARSGGPTALLSKKMRVQVLHEVFADRGYDRDGNLIPRGQPGALLTPAKAALRAGGKITDRDGVPLALRADTFCVHGDSPDAAAILRAFRDARRRR